MRTQQRWQQLDEAASLSQEYASLPLWKHRSTHADTQARLLEVHSKLPRQTCQHCGLSFGTLKALQSHVAQKHGAQAGEVNPSLLSVLSSKCAGITCVTLQEVSPRVHCHWNFSSWPAFCEHFELGRCVALNLSSGIAPETSATALEASATPVPQEEPLQW